jgi:predicted XRE-type DNA-binding protein
MRYPSKQKLKEMEEKLKDVKGAKSLPLNASPVDRLKYDLCREIVSYLVKNRVNQKDLADELGVDPAVISRIVNYNIDNFTVDILGSYVAALRPGVRFKVG